MKCPQPYVKWHSEHEASEYPCGRCLACRQLRAQDWAQRIKYELEDKTKTGDFVTLTYDDDHLAHNQLDKRDLQNTFKRIRHHHKIKYYACGEYGEKFGRKHFHALVIRDGTEDLDYNNYWKNGEIHVGSITDASIAYCTGYILKANPVPSWVTKGHEPFHIWSRGIGDEFMKGKRLLEMAREGNIPRRWRALADENELPEEVYKNPAELTKGWEKYGRRKAQTWFRERTRSQS
ncbi:MAG: replication initiator protein [Microvirus sp.]|nr:MAG: replication initiator protein [Microvirus sp.]